MGGLADPAQCQPCGRWERLRRIFEIDLRALAAFRVGIGVLLLADVYLRFRTLTVYHTDAGVLPRDAMLESSRTAILSVYMLNGGAPFAALLLSVTALCALMLIVGYKTRLVTFLCWLLLMSVQRRNIMVLNSGDLLFCLLYFWSMFLPLGAVASVDSLGKKSAATTPPPRAVCSAATVAILVQMIYVYVVSAVLKNHPVWRTDGTAVYYALHVDRLVSLNGLRIREYYEFMRFMTFATFYLELIVPFLAFIPVANKVLRSFTAFAFIGFHLGLAVSLHIVLFPYICVVAWLLFLPSEFWDFLGRFRLVEAVRGAWSWVVSGGASLARWAGRYLRPLEPRVKGWRIGLVEQAVVGLLAVYVLAENVSDCNKSFRMPKTLQPLASVLWLGQNWGMFAPYPMKDDGWFVVPARLADGSEVDLRTWEPPTFEKPYNLAMTFGGPRWRKFSENIWRGKHRPKVVFYANWLRNRWNQQHGPDQQIEAMQFYHVVEFTRPYPEEPYVSPPQLMYEWEGPGTDHWIAFSQNQKDYSSRMHREVKRRMLEHTVQAVQGPGGPVR